MHPSRIVQIVRTGPGYYVILDDAGLLFRGATQEVKRDDGHVDYYMNCWPMWLTDASESQ